jgi:tight adherence protein C
MISLLLVFLGAGACGVMAFTLLNGVLGGAPAESGLDMLDDYGQPATAEAWDNQQLEGSLIQRLTPNIAGLTGLARRFTPVGYVDRVRTKFVRAGDPSQSAVDAFMAVRAITVVAAPFVFLGLLFVLPMGGMLKLASAGLISIALLMLPDVRLNRRVEEREKRIRQDLPSVLDLLSISVEAGLGFDQAVDRVIQNVPGPLSSEFGRMLGEIRAGANRPDALRAMEARIDMPDVRSFLLAVLQADTFGVSIARVLKSQADEARVKRRQQAQEKAQKAPVKMLLPIVFCIFPALFVVVLGPAMINIMEQLA